MQGDRAAVTVGVRLAYDADDGLVLLRPQAPTTESGTDQILGFGAQPHPPVGQRGTHLAIGGIADRILFGEPIGPPFVTDQVLALRAAQRRGLHPGRHRLCHDQDGQVLHRPRVSVRYRIDPPPRAVTSVGESHPQRLPGLTPRHDHMSARQHTIVSNDNGRPERLEVVFGCVDCGYPRIRR